MTNGKGEQGGAGGTWERPMRFVHYLQCGGGFMGARMCQNIKLYTYIVCHSYLSKAALKKTLDIRQDKHLLRNRGKGLEESVTGETVQGGNCYFLL